MNRIDLESRALIMCGISGSGKTHYAGLLEKQGYIRLSADAFIWDKTGGKLFSLPKNEQKHLFLESGVYVRRQLVKLLKEGKKVVVDATHCKRIVRDEIRNLCCDIGVKPFFIYCSDDEEKLWDRLSKRRGTGPDDLIVTREELTEYYRGFERPQNDETDFIYL